MRSSWCRTASTRHFANGIGERGAAKHAEWRDLFAALPPGASRPCRPFEAMQRARAAAGWDEGIPTFPADPKGIASRDCFRPSWRTRSRRHVPWLIGGAADLAPSTKTRMTFEGAGDFQPENHGGRNLHFGVREHAMGAAVNGMALAKLRPFGSGFLIFSDYMRNPIRLSAIMELPSLYVFTHDSIGVGEDGPTHQPVEQLAGLRAIPGLITLRPCDANEVAEAWRVVLKAKHQPACLILTRQALPTLDRSRFAPASGVARGAYVLADLGGAPPRVILIGTGSEVSLCVAAAEQLAAGGRSNARRQHAVLGTVRACRTRPIERRCCRMRSTLGSPSSRPRSIGWERYVGRRGAVVGMHTFGASAPLKGLLTKFGFTPEHVVKPPGNRWPNRRAEGDAHMTNEHPSTPQVRSRRRRNRPARARW